MPDRYAVVGNPIAHSKSPVIHAHFARATGEDLVYAAMLAPLDDFAGAVRRFQAAGGRGVNVTVPFKEEAFSLAAVRTERAERAGAVNTLWFDSGGTWHGDNTDGVGLVVDLTRNRGVTLRGRRILLLGAGGAARGIVGPLLDQGPEDLVILNRTARRARILAEGFRGSGPVRGGGTTEAGAARFDVVVNATSSGLDGGAPPVPLTVLEPHGCCYDMVYADAPTPFLRWARAAGADLMFDGLGMLVEQAAEAFWRWRGVRPETAPVLAALRPDPAKTLVGTSN